MSKSGQDTFAENAQSKVKIKIIKGSCISAAICIVKSPNTFDLDEDGIAFVKEGTWDDAATIINAAKSCPTLAIIIEDMSGKQIYPEVSANA